MSVGAKRSPVRPLGTTNLSLAYPGELLIDPTTGDFIYINDAKQQIPHKKPGKLTIKSGEEVLVNAVEMSQDISVELPAGAPGKFTATIGATKVIDSVSMAQDISLTIPEASAAEAGIVSIGAQTFAGAKTFSGGINTTTLAVTNTAIGSVFGVSQNLTNLSLSTSWSGTTAPYTQALTVSGLLATDVPVVDFRPTGTYATDKTAETAWLNIYRILVAANTLTFYAHEKPTVAIPITIKLVR